jgi:hypothetical protein
MADPKKTVSLSELLKAADENDDLRARVEHLERAVLLLAKHVGAVGWNYELQRALDLIREIEWSK